MACCFGKHVSWKMKPTVLMQNIARPRAKRAALPPNKSNTFRKKILRNLGIWSLEVWFLAAGLQWITFVLDVISSNFHLLSYVIPARMYSNPKWQTFEVIPCTRCLEDPASTWPLNCAPGAICGIHGKVCWPRLKLRQNRSGYSQTRSMLRVGKLAKASCFFDFAYAWTAWKNATK